MGTTKTTKWSAKKVQQKKASALQFRGRFAAWDCRAEARVPFAHGFFEILGGPFSALTSQENLVFGGGEGFVHVIFVLGSWPCWQNTPLTANTPVCAIGNRGTCKFISLENL